MAKKSNPIKDFWPLLVLLAIGAFAEVLKKIWPFLLIVGVLYLLYRFSSKKKAESSSEPTVTSLPDKRRGRTPSTAVSRPESLGSMTSGAKSTQKAADETESSTATDRTFVRTVSHEGVEHTIEFKISLGSDKGHRIPPAPKELSRSIGWLRPEESVEVAGTRIMGGMLYVGTPLRNTYGGADPALIDPTLSVAKAGDFTVAQTGYWASYSQISPQARRAYLHWLADGRRHPEADIGFVFLYFYGLERRAVVDIIEAGGNTSELPTIAAELRRLLEIYGQRNQSFRAYCSRLIDFISLVNHGERMYREPVPDYVRTWELPCYIKLAIGQAAVDGVPVPAHLALAWAELDPSISLRTAATRCRTEFRKLFALKYQSIYGDGIKLSPNRTRLKFVYTAASAGLVGRGEFAHRFEGIPDISVLSGPTKKLQEVVDACSDSLAAYSRYIAKNPGQEFALDALVLLPVELWPEQARQSLAALQTKLSGSTTLMKMQEMLQTFGSAGDLTREKLLAFARALESAQIGMEPDVLGGARVPKVSDSIVLFSLTGNPAAEPRTTPAYQAAAITLDLAAAVAHADGDFSAAESEHLRSNVDSWVHLSALHRTRLKARVHLLMAMPVSLAGMKKKVEVLDDTAREAIAGFTALMVQSDGHATPEEVRLLEKIYTLLGIERSKVYSQVHAVATGAKETIANKKSDKGASPSFELDASRIAALQKDSEKVSALLGAIFNEETELQQAEQEKDEPSEPAADTSVMGLDAPHSAFVRTLLSRHSWERTELEDVASDLQVMLDGALEKINEVAFDTYDLPVTEGDDPVEINPEFLEIYSNERTEHTS